MCLYPTLIKNPKYKATKKNGGHIPAVLDERTRYVPIGCQQCIECRKQKAQHWNIRLQEDIRTNTNGKFITLTMSNQNYSKLYKKIERYNKEKNIDPEPYTMDNIIIKKAVRLFTDNWRKEHKKAIRHWLVSELGHNGTENIHLHGILWTDENYNTIERIWKQGHIFPTEQTKRYTWVNEKTINYITKYVNKIDAQHKHYKSIILTSAGIGANYINRTDSKKNIYNGTETIETYRTRTGTKQALPIYYRNKLYTEQEREQLWTQKLDKQERWVLGLRIDISHGDKEYLLALKHAQKINKKLGYNSNEKNWEQEEYERQRRILKQKERIHASGGKILD